MAGYGTDVEVPTAFDGLARAILQAAQRRGAALDLRVRYRRVGESSPGWTSWALTVDGASVFIAAWARQIERELPIVAEGYVGPGAGRSAVRVARSFVARWIEWCVGDVLGDVSDRVTVARDDHARVFWPLFDPPDLPHDLAERLFLADELLARWMVRDLPDEVGLEEMQTAFEIVLRRLTGAGQRAPFPALLDRAVNRGLIDDDGHTALRDLNDRRRAVKHHGGVVPSDDKEAVRAALHNGAWILDRLEGRLRHAAPV